MQTYLVTYSTLNLSGDRYMRRDCVKADNGRDARAIIKIRRPDARKIVVARI